MPNAEKLEFLLPHNRPGHLYIPSLDDQQKPNNQKSLHTYRNADDMSKKKAQMCVKH